MFAFSKLDTLKTYFAYEKCADNVALGCWSGRDGLFRDYFILFDGTLNGLLTSKTYCWYAYASPDSTFNFSSEISSRTFVDSIIIVDQDREKLEISDSKLGGYLWNKIISLQKSENYLSITYPKLEKWLNKSRNQEKIAEEGFNFNIVEHPNSFGKITSMRIYYIYEVEIVVHHFNKLSERLFFDYTRPKQKRFKRKWYEIENYYLVSIFKLRPLSSKELEHFKKDAKHLDVRINK